MGQRTREKAKGGNNRIYASGTEDDKQALESTAATSEEKESLSDYLDILLTNVDANIQTVTKLHDQVWIDGFSVYADAGRLGDIPQRLVSKVMEGNFNEGYVVNIDIVKVRLFA